MANYALIIALIGTIKDSILEIENLIQSIEFQEVEIQGTLYLNEAEIAMDELRRLLQKEFRNKIDCSVLQEIKRLKDKISL